MPLDVLTVGRSSVDLYPLQSGVPLEDVATFGRFLGGSPTNVAVGARRLGNSSGVITAVGEDPFGRYVRRALEGYGVQTDGVVAMPGVPTSLAFCEVFPPDSFPLHFRRADPAPELRLTLDDVDRSVVADARLLWLTATGLSHEGSRAMHHALLDARAGALSVLDLDYRAMFWGSRAAATEHVRAAVARVSVTVGNLEECAVATGTNDPDRAADALLAAGVTTAIVKLGPAGVLGATASTRIRVAPTPCEVRNGLGAGDAFGGALCHGLLAGWPLERTLRHASAAGAIVASQLECAGAMPDLDQLERVLALGFVPSADGEEEA